MYFRSDERARLLSISDSFAQLSVVHANGDLGFTFTYALKQSEAVKRGTTRVEVSVSSRQVSSPRVIGQRGRADAGELVRSARTAIIDAKSAALQRSRYRITSKQSDITAVINNEVVPQLLAGVPPSSIQSMRANRLTLVPVSSLKKANDPRPVLHRLANVAAVPDVQLAMSASLLEDPRSLMQDMVVRQGVDPSSVASFTPRDEPASRLRAGTLTPTRANETTVDPATRLLNHYVLAGAPAPAGSTQDLIDTDLVQALEPSTIDAVSVDVDVRLSPSQLQLEGANLAQVYVTFDLIAGDTGRPIDSVTKVLNVARHVQLYVTPKVPPIVGIARSEASSRINIEVRQVDRAATGVQIFRKIVNVSSSDAAEYALIGTYDLASSDQSLLVPVDRPVSSPAIYRVIPVGQQSTVGFEYTNVVVRPARYTPIKAAALATHQVDVGIQLELRNLPDAAVAVMFLRWNASQFQRDPLIVNSDAVLIDDTARRAGIVTTVDGSVDRFSTYRYVARMTFNDGIYHDVGPVVVDFVQPAPGAVDTRLTDLTVSHDTAPNVTFTMSTFTVDTDVDAIKRMLEVRGIDTFFSGDVQLQRDQLGDLIAHNVQRVDLSTGQRDDFGVITDRSFDDGALRQNQSIGPLQYGHKYRYEVLPLLRAPETMFDSFTKAVVDPTSKRSYSYSPSKYRHPLALDRGILVSPGGARLRYAKSPMAYGAVGSIASVDVSFDDDSLQIIDASAAQFDRSTSVVSWKVAGNVHRVDHFLVMKQVHGIRSVIGKTHSEFPYGSCQYAHVLSAADAGALSYSVVPVFNDYRVGSAANTNVITIGAA